MAPLFVSNDGMGRAVAAEHAVGICLQLLYAQNRKVRSGCSMRRLIGQANRFCHRPLSLVVMDDRLILGVGCYRLVSVYRESRYEGNFASHLLGAARILANIWAARHRFRGSVAGFGSHHRWYYASLFSRR